MKKLAVRLSALLALLFSANAFSGLPVAVADALKKAGIPQSNVAVYVQAVDETAPLISHNANNSFNPASVMKLVTTNAALDLLTPAYRWKTEVYRDGEVNGGILKGNLIIKGYGDPSFNVQEFWRLLMATQQAGIANITGNLIVDRSYFPPNVGNGKTIDNEAWRAYNAMPSAFLVNGRNTSFKFNVTDAKVTINQEFALQEIQIVNNMVLSQQACGDWRSQMRYDIKPSEVMPIEIKPSETKPNQTSFGNDKIVVTFNGGFSSDCGERYLELSVLNDAQYAFYTFKKLWRELGGGFTGQLKVHELPSSAIKVTEQFSEPLGHIVRDINKWSNNLMARQLLLTLSAEKQDLPVTEAKGAVVIKDWLNTKNINASELVIENGSGLSRIERISSANLGKMLVSTYHGPVMPELIASLPILGLDGTTKMRLKDSLSAGRVHIKTGSIDGISAIAGYILDAQNKRYVVVMMVNHVNAAASKMAQDSLMEWVYKQAH